mgnify:CR=1 FL=1
MDEATLYTIVISLITALSSTRAWDFWKHRTSVAAAVKEKEQQDENLYRDDLREEVRTLRQRLTEAQDKITVLSKRLAEMTVRVEFLEKENNTLKQGA